MNRNVIADTNVMGLIVIAILAFLLGIAVTVFCFYLKRQHREYERDVSDRKDR